MFDFQNLFIFKIISVFGDPNKYDRKEFLIPDHLICKITLELIEDPYITPAGTTCINKLF